MAAQSDIYLQRNEDYVRRWVLTSTDDAPLDITGCTITLQVKSRVDNSTVIATGEIGIIDAENGEIEVRLHGSSGHPLSTYGSPLQVENLRYDVLLIYPDGIHMPLVTGTVVLSRGTTQP